jgi:ATP-binding cassette subfamily F protein uup
MRELEVLPEKIERLEREQAALFASLADPSFYRSEGRAIAKARSRLDEVENELASAYRRWEDLDATDRGAEASA